MVFSTKGIIPHYHSNKTTSKADKSQLTTTPPPTEHSHPFVPLPMPPIYGNQRNISDWQKNNYQSSDRKISSYQLPLNQSSKPVTELPDLTKGGQSSLKDPKSSEIVNQNVQQVPTNISNALPNLSSVLPAMLTVKNTSTFQPMKNINNARLQSNLNHVIGEDRFQAANITADNKDSFNANGSMNKVTATSGNLKIKYIAGLTNDTCKHCGKDQFVVSNETNKNQSFVENLKVLSSIQGSINTSLGISNQVLTGQDKPGSTLVSWSQQNLTNTQMSSSQPVVGNYHLNHNVSGQSNKQGASSKPGSTLVSWSSQNSNNTQMALSTPTPGGQWTWAQSSPSPYQGKTTQNLNQTQWKWSEQVPGMNKTGSQQQTESLSTTQKPFSTQVSLSKEKLTSNGQGTWSDQTPNDNQGFMSTVKPISSKESRTTLTPLGSINLNNILNETTKPSTSTLSTTVWKQQESVSSSVLSTTTLPSSKSTTTAPPLFSITKTAPELKNGETGDLGSVSESSKHPGQSTTSSSISSTTTLASSQSTTTVLPLQSSTTTAPYIISSTISGTEKDKNVPKVEYILGGNCGKLLCPVSTTQPPVLVPIPELYIQEPKHPMFITTLTPPLVPAAPPVATTQSTTKTTTTKWIPTTRTRRTTKPFSKAQPWSFIDQTVRPTAPKHTKYITNPSPHISTTTRKKATPTKSKVHIKYPTPKFSFCCNTTSNQVRPIPFKQQGNGYQVDIYNIYHQLPTDGTRIDEGMLLSLPDCDSGKTNCNSYKPQSNLECSKLPKCNNTIVGMEFKGKLQGNINLALMTPNENGKDFKIHNHEMNVNQANANFKIQSPQFMKPKYNQVNTNPNPLISFSPLYPPINLNPFMQPNYLAPPNNWGYQGFQNFMNYQGLKSGYFGELGSPQVFNWKSPYLKARSENIKNDVTNMTAKDEILDDEVLSSIKDVSANNGNVIYMSDNPKLDNLSPSRLWKNSMLITINKGLPIMTSAHLVTGEKLFLNLSQPVQI